MDALVAADNDLRAEGLDIIMRLGQDGVFAYDRIAQIARTEKEAVDLRESAIRILGEIGQKRNISVAILNKLQKDESVRIQQASKSALSRLSAIGAHGPN